MAEGGDDNPFSFKKFIKAKDKDRLSSDSETEESEEETVVDLLETSCQNKADTGQSHRKVDDNPFSFKRFLQASGGSSGRGNALPATGSNGANGIATLDLANDLPDFVQDHYHSTDRDLLSTPASSASSRCRAASRQPAVDALLPDFALDASDHISSRSFIDSSLYKTNGWTGSPSSLGTGSSRWLHHPTGGNPECQEIRSNSPPGNNLLHHPSSSDLDDNLEFNAPDDVSRHSDASSLVDVRHRLSAHAAGGLPDFLSDSALAVTGTVSGMAAVHDSSSELLTNGLNNHLIDNDLSQHETTVRRLQDENRELRRQLREAQELAQQETVRAAEAVKQMELSQKHEAEETAALERMVQQVEANLHTTTQRALHSESVVAKLKQELKLLQSRVELLEAENVQLRSVSSDSSNILRDRALYAAQQINVGALDAEQMLRQLLAGVEKLRMVSDILASTDKVTSLAPDEVSDK